MHFSRIRSTRRSALILALPALLAAAPVTAGVRTFTAVQVNSATSVSFDPDADVVRDTSGAPVEISVQGSNDLGVSNGSGFTTKTFTDDVFGRASVGSGDLKARASLGFATDLGGDPVPINTRNGSSSVTASMGDSFHAYTGSKAFAWTADTKVHFAFDLDGSTTIPEGLPSANTSSNMVYAEFVVRILKPGGVDLWHRLQTFDFLAYPNIDAAYEAYGALNNAYSAAVVGSTYWTLAGSIVGYTLDPDHLFTLDESGHVHLEYEFAPGGDFDWVMTMETMVQLDASLQETTVALDFGDTVATAYTGPDGATTYSASGVYPGTSPESEITALCGDANADGKVSSSDALKALRAAVGGDPCVGPVCDVDSSGGVTASDALKILKVAVGQVVTLNCGAAI